MQGARHIEKGEKNTEMITEKSIKSEVLTIETLTETDVHDVVRLSNLLERGYAESEIRMILQAGNLLGHRSGEGTIVSTAAILPYQGNLASLGVVMVDYRYRRRGLATRLVQTCMDIVPEYSVMLVATDEGKPLYEKLGFRTVDTLHRMIAGEYQYQRPAHLQMQYTQFCSIDEQDLPELLKLDQEAFGADRSKFLNLRLRQAKYTSILRNHAGRCTGYALAVPTPELLVIGPVVAPDSRLAFLLIDDIARRYQGKIQINIPSVHQDLIRFLMRCGFKLARIAPVMMSGVYRMPPRNHLFAVSDRSYG
ncbi:N-acetyltransferase [Polycladomyces abyssicola]|uniref:N-acetyltransferase n=1 Tax=Polycladomyces abyssicola TaxID=1125966 RepID=A0A8D5UFT4_9BACL|nr:GNAT family N-acetyltransferase [Polycladomyces abyssicola]BCU81489.1 N-acetyltransferase [Polycladomyces abyssicola]